ncbi:hypothetical protein SDC9_58547 [bioreactor metagenome]|uniref:Uncharacterized protein n=1 Tax=bioreactor metagenome TaxID=1076179 RepID=A0A644X7Q1_9ZZZZ
MKQSDFSRNKEIFLCSDAIREHAFKTFGVWVSYALLASANHILAMDFSVAREKSAHFGKEDCFECLSPHIAAA